MHAVVSRVSISDFESAQKGLQERVVPRVSQAPGFVAGYWTRSDAGTDGLSLVLFESEENARQAAEMIRSGENLAEGVTLESVEVREVVQQATA